MEESRSRWLRTCKRQKEALAEYKMFWGLRLYTRIYIFRTILWHRKRHTYISKCGLKLIIKKKKRLLCHCIGFSIHQTPDCSECFFFMLQRVFLAQQHHWQERKAPWAVASPGSLMGCIPFGNTTATSHNSQFCSQI